MKQPKVGEVIEVNIETIKIKKTDLVISKSSHQISCRDRTS